MNGIKGPPALCGSRAEPWPCLPDIAAGRRAHHTDGMHSSVTLILNGESRLFEGPADGPLSLMALLLMLGLDTRKVAVERNEEIVPRSRYAETWLASGDALEIVHFIGGG
jgi:sulfur carrier protein